jgi:hypothetical protein
METDFQKALESWSEPESDSRASGAGLFARFRDVLCEGVVVRKVWLRGEGTGANSDPLGRPRI